MLGKKVRVFWPVDSTWYTGVVEKFDADSGEHLLIYPDGDSEWVKIGETTGGSGGDGAPADGLHSGPAVEKAAMMNMDHEQRKLMGEMGASAYMPYPMPPGYPPFYGVPGMPPYGMYPPGYMYPGSMPHSDKGDDFNSESDRSRKNGPKAWTKEEDALLLAIVKKMQMPMKWSIVALSLPDRSGKVSVT
jgi:hypothetical protein